MQCYYPVPYTFFCCVYINKIYFGDNVRNVPYLFIDVLIINILLIKNNFLNFNNLHFIIIIIYIFGYKEKKYDN